MRTTSNSRFGLIFYFLFFGVFAFIWILYVLSTVHKVPNYLNSVDNQCLRKRCKVAMDDLPAYRYFTNITADMIKYDTMAYSPDSAELKKEHVHDEDNKNIGN